MLVKLRDDNKANFGKIYTNYPPITYWYPFENYPHNFLYLWVSMILMDNSN